eukprot:scaffold3977_cov107-Isochrysis_galbana.AAC.1
MKHAACRMHVVRSVIGVGVVGAPQNISSAWAEMGCHPDTGLGCRRVLLCCLIAAVDGSRSRIVAGSSRANRLAAMPPFLALCGGVVGGVVENGGSFFLPAKGGHQIQGRA